MKKRLIGEKRHNLTLLKVLKPSTKDKQGIILCKCDCGKTKELKQNKFGITKSCGCLKHRKGENCPSFAGYQEIYGRQWWQIKKNADQRNFKFDITIEDAWDLYEKQDRLCKLSDLPIEFGMKNWTASLDRIDSSKGYIKGNVQWVHVDINKIKMDLSQDYFIELCDSVSKKSRT